ncbi:MAG: hypothetical protein ACOCRZ_05770 [Halothermotrichaceae bacterium]
MVQRRMSYRIPEKTYKKLIEKLEEKGLDFDNFLDKAIDLYLEDQIDPKEQTEGWGKWMEGH